MITSKLTGRGRTTIPVLVRQALRLRQGDEIAYRIEAGRVILTRTDPAVPADPFAAFGEWSSEADRQAYADL
jgi:antitoxin PrlF